MVCEERSYIRRYIERNANNLNHFQGAGNSVPQLFIYFTIISIGTYYIYVTTAVSGTEYSGE